MTTESQLQHVERVVELVTLGNRAPRSAALDDFIRRSWVRCVNHHGLDPTCATEAPLVPSFQLRRHRERMDEFLDVARAGMEQLYRQVAPLGYVILLSDREGVTVDYLAGAGRERDLREAGVYVGMDWREERAGTNGIGTVLIEKTPLICHQADHFNARHISLSCIAAPIFDPNGELLAVLNLTAMSAPGSKDSQHLALQLISMQAKAIEDVNFFRHFRDRWLLRLSRTWPFAEVSGEVLLAVDDDGRIAGANTAARSALAAAGRSGRPVIGRSLPEVFDCTMDDVLRVAWGKGADNLMVAPTGGRASYALSVRPPRGRPGNLPRPGWRSRLPVAVEVDGCAALDALAGSDASMEHILGQARRLADRKINILVQGETGSGKELFARALHQSSARARNPFVAFNCAAIPESLIESELFGYAPGAFTGGRSKGMKGLIQQSDGGTLFLDEIGDMPLHLQTRLLRVLSESEVMPIGADGPVRIDLAVIAATHRDLRLMVTQGSFREDLYYRLAGAILHLPPLRERSDIRFLIDRLLEKESGSLAPAPLMTAAAMDMLVRHSWPGNIRELRNALRYALAMSEDGSIRPSDLPREIAVPRADADLAAGRTGTVRSTATAAASSAANQADDERDRLLLALRAHQWNITAAAAELGVSRVTVYRRMKRLGIVSPVAAR